MTITDYKHLRISDTETGDAADDLNENFEELAERTGEIVRISTAGDVRTNGGASPFKFTAYHPSADTDAARGTALAAAIAAAGVGDIIRLAPGTYALDAQITSIPNWLTIQGSGFKTVISSSDPDIIDVTNTIGLTVRDLASAGRWNFSSANRIRFINCQMDNSGGSQCIFCDTAGSIDSYDWLIEKCEFLSGTGFGEVYVYLVDRMRVLGCNFWNSSASGLRMYQGGASSSDSEVWSGPIIANCHFRNAADYGLVLEGVHDPVVAACTFEDCADGGLLLKGPISSLITGCTFERNRTGANAAAITIDINDLDAYDNMSGGDGNYQIVGCRFGLEKNGIIIDTSHAGEKHFGLVSGNSFHADDESAGACGVKLTDYVAGSAVMIHGNLFTAGTGHTPSKAIRVEGDSTTDGTYLRIFNNCLDGYATGLEVDGLTDVLNRDNDMQDVTDAESLLNGGTTRSA